MTKTMNERFEERFPLDQLHDYHELTGHIARKGEIADFIQSEIDLAKEEEKKKIVDLIINAGQNRISMLDPELPRCEACLNGFTGTYWISQNDIIFFLTGSYLSDYKDKIISIK